MRTLRMSEKWLGFAESSSELGVAQTSQLDGCGVFIHELPHYSSQTELSSIDRCRHYSFTG